MKHHHVLPALLVAILCGSLVIPARADDAPIKLKLKAGDVARVSSPVVVEIDVPEGAKSATVKIGEKTIPGQIAGPGLMSTSGKSELHFLLPKLDAGAETEALVTLSDKEPADPKFQWVQTENSTRELRCIGCHKEDVDNSQGKPLLRYVHTPLDPEKREETYKVFHHVYDFAGEDFITKGPGGKYTHHRGIFYGFSRTTYDQNKKCDTWHCRGAHLSHNGFLAEDAGRVMGRHCVGVDWVGEVGGEDKTFAKEQRQLAIYRAKAGSYYYVIDFASRLTATDGTVQVDGDPQHAGFHFRASQKVADGDQKNSYYVRPDGVGAPGETRNWPGNKEMVDLPWNAMSVVIDDERYTVLYLDKPTNPKEARFSERSYGRFGSYFVAEATEDKPLDVAYRLVVVKGELTPEQAAAYSADFLNPVEVEVVK